MTIRPLLAKVFGFCQQKPEYCDKAAAYFANGVNETIKLQNAPIAQKDVLLVLRPLAYRANVKERAKPAGVGEIGTLNGGLYEVSRVLLHEQWAELAAAQNGTLIVALPSSDRLLYVSEKTPEALDALLTLSRHAATKSSSPFAPNLLLSWTPQGWEIVR